MAHGARGDGEGVLALADDDVHLAGHAGQQQCGRIIQAEDDPVNLVLGLGQDFFQRADEVAILMGVEPDAGLHAGGEVTDVLLVHLRHDLVLGAADEADLRLRRNELAEVDIFFEDHAIHRRSDRVVAELVVDRVARPFGVLDVSVQREVFLLHLVLKAGEGVLRLLVFNG